MRLPKVGEEGWQVGEPDGSFTDCDILAVGPDMYQGYTIDNGFVCCARYNDPSGHPTRAWQEEVKRFRRKPEQKDNQAAHNTFQEIMDSLMGRVKGKTEVVK